MPGHATTFSRNPTPPQPEHRCHRTVDNRNTPQGEPYGVNLLNYMKIYFNKVKRLTAAEKRHLQFRITCVRNFGFL